MPPKVVIKNEVPNTVGSKHNITPSLAGNNGSSASAASLFGSNTPSNAAKPLASLKRKANDPNLPVVCIDAMHDLTLIVGTPDSPGGQKAFQVNKGSVRHASSVWSAMLSGDWAESGMSEVSFPDDSCYAFQIVLEIAHLQFAKLPESLTQMQLIDIAKLADKYDLGQVLPAVVEFKKWLHPFKDPAGYWPTDTDFQDFAIITSAFKLPAEFDYIVNYLALHVNVDELGKYYYQDSKQKKVTLGSCLPSRVFVEIDCIRSEVLSAWNATCTVGLNEVIKATNSLCRRKVCSSTKIGVLVRGLQSAGFFPSPTSTKDMHRSVLDYWRGLKAIGSSSDEYDPCYAYGAYRQCAHTAQCTFNKCFGDFSVKTAARLTLERHTHKVIWQHWTRDQIV